jgi:hypothetical protein
MRSSKIVQKENRRIHIARIDFAKFYQSAFSSAKESRCFCERVKTLAEKRPDPQTILHQGGRMIWLADRIDKVAGGRPSFQVMFYLTAAELVAKLVFKYNRENRSREFVQKFFEEICTEKHQTRLAQGFTDLNRSSGLTCREVIDLLYDIRCDVVHRGQYFLFNLQSEESSDPMMTNARPNWLSRIKLSELRQIMLEGVIQGCRKAGHPYFEK